MDRWIEEWCSCNFAAGSFHTKKLCSRLFDRSWILLAKQQGLRGNVHSSFMAHWKARGRLRISANWTFFASSHGWGVMNRYLSKSWFLKGGGSFWVQISGEGRVSHQRLLASENLESLGYHVALFARSYVQPFWYNTGVWQTDMACKRTVYNTCCISGGVWDRKASNSKHDLQGN